MDVEEGEGNDDGVNEGEESMLPATGGVSQDY